MKKFLNTGTKIIHVGTTILMPGDPIEVDEATANCPAFKLFVEQGKLTDVGAPAGVAVVDTDSDAFKRAVEEAAARMATEKAAEAQKKAEEERAAAAEAKKAAEEAKKAAEDEKSAAAAAKKAAEDAQKAAEEAKKGAEEAKKKAEEEAKKATEKKATEDTAKAGK